ncbi:MAG: SDR family oxidoreductase [Deltaproteobacteria bacterium]|nr:SDR family oxidoreductase [Deltaproteobacteria bacterium]
MDALPHPTRWLITGANRGIGLELTRQLLRRGDAVVATARHPESARELAALAERAPGRLTVAACDVTDRASVEALAAAVREPLDVLVSNAGVYGESETIESLDDRDMLRTLDTNALGALRVTAALLPHLRRGRDKKIVAITSGMGSIGDNKSGGAYGYRMSKAALNMAMRSLAVDLEGEGVTVVVVNPGWVKTDMGGASAPTTVEESASRMIALIDRLTPTDSGTFFDYRGYTWPW